MGTYEVFRRRAPHIVVTVTALIALSLTSLAPLVSADTTSYSAEDIENWLVAQITSAQFEITDATVDLDSSFNAMTVEGLRLDVLGISIGVEAIDLDFSAGDPLDVFVTIDLDLFGIQPTPRLQGMVSIACEGPDGTLEVTDIGDISIGGFEPTLTAADLERVIDAVNQVIEASGLTMSPPNATLTEVSVVDHEDEDKLRLAWSDSSETYRDTAFLENTTDSMVQTLRTKANDYLAASDQWSIDVEVITDTALRIQAQASAYDITATLNADVTFDGLTATISDATFAIGGGTPSKQVSFSAEGEIGCQNFTPFVDMTSFELGDEFPNLKDFIEEEELEATILGVVKQAVDSIVEATGLTLPYWSIASIEIVGDHVVITELADVGIDLVLQPGWNMVSVPLELANSATASVFDHEDVAAVYSWDPTVAERYVIPETIDHRYGYWVAVDADAEITIEVRGQPVDEWSREISTGWHMIGSLTVQASVDAITHDDAGDPLWLDRVWTWDGTTFVLATNIVPGKGYWLASDSDCTVTLGPP